MTGVQGPISFLRASGSGAAPARGLNVRPLDLAPIRGRLTRLDRAPQTGISRLVAGAVPGRVDFGSSSGRARSRLSFYTHPADRNEAGVGVQIGRTLDVSG